MLSCWLGQPVSSLMLQRTTRNMRFLREVKKSDAVRKELGVEDGASSCDLVSFCAEDIFSLVLFVFVDVGPCVGGFLVVMNLSFASCVRLQTWTQAVRIFVSESGVL